MPSDYTVIKIANTPPVAGSVVAGDLFLVGPNPAIGTPWVGHAGEIARVLDPAVPTFTYVLPYQGTQVLVRDDSNKKAVRRFTQVNAATPYLWVAEDIGPRMIADQVPAGGFDIYSSDIDFAVALVAGSTTVLQLAGLPAALANVRLSQILKVWQFVEGMGPPNIFRIDENTIAWDNAAQQITIPTAQFTANDAFLVEIKGPPKVVSVDISEDIIGAPGAAAPAEGVQIMGVDGTGTARVPLTNAAGELSVIQAVAANLNCTEASAAAILAAAVQIALAVGQHDAVRAARSILCGLRAHSGNPAPVSADDEQVDGLATPLGQPRVYLDSHMTTTNDEMGNLPKAPAEIVAHGQWVPAGVAGNTTQLTATSVECALVVICPDPYQPGVGPVSEFFWGGFSYTSGNGTIVAAGPIPANGLHRAIKAHEVSAGNVLTLYHCTPAVIPVDDPSKIYGACSVIGAAAAHRAFYWVAFGRGHVVGGS